jgi:hypothetical protein
MPLQCNFRINVNSRGGQCLGGFPDDSPTLSSSDYIAVNVTLTGVPANQTPPDITAYFIVSTDPKAKNQTLATPFTQANDANSPLVCFFTRQMPGSAAVGNPPVYSCQSPTYYGGAQGSYELTAVFQTSTGQQYSEDPEFDTGV